jgi:phosphatidylglycerophosphate synthase
MAADAHYEYKFQDNSILQRLLEPVLFVPLVRKLPRGITPNQITITGQLAIAAAFAVVLTVRPMTAAAYVFVATAIVFYTLADCVDGLFARHTQQTSRLGELLDHWLDALSIPLVVLCLGLALQAAPWCTFTGVLAISFLHFAIFLHGYRFGHVILGAVGMIESACIGAVVCLIAVLFGPEPLTRLLVAGLSVSSILLLSVVAGACSSLFSMRGLLRHLADFANLAALLAALALWFSFGRVPLALAGFCVIAVGSYLEGHVIRSRLLRTPLMRTDALLLLLVLGGAAASLALDLDAGAQTLLLGFACGYALLRGGIAFTQTITALRASAPAARPAQN